MRKKKHICLDTCFIAKKSRDLLIRPTNKLQVCHYKHFITLKLQRKKKDY